MVLYKHTRPILTSYPALWYATWYTYNWLILVDMHVNLSAALSKPIVQIS